MPVENVLLFVTLSAQAAAIKRTRKATKRCRKRLGRSLAALEAATFAGALPSDAEHLREIGSRVCRACGKCEGGVMQRAPTDQFRA